MVRLLKMLLLGGAISQGAYAAADESRLNGRSHEQRYHDLLVARADAIGRAYQARHDEFLAGRGTPNIYLSSAQRLRDAELSLAVSADERVAILDEYWQELWSCERIQPNVPKREESPSRNTLRRPLDDLKPKSHSWKRLLAGHMQQPSEPIENLVPVSVSRLEMRETPALTETLPMLDPSSRRRTRRN
jgi:hypothetical protein